MRPAESAPEPSYADRRKQMEAFASLSPLPTFATSGRWNWPAARRSVCIR